MLFRLKSAISIIKIKSLRASPSPHLIRDASYHWKAGIRYFATVKNGLMTGAVLRGLLGRVEPVVGRCKLCVHLFVVAFLDDILEPNLAGLLAG